MEVRFKNFVTIRGSYTEQGLSNHITFRPIKSGATVPLRTPGVGFSEPIPCEKRNQLLRGVDSPRKGGGEVLSKNRVHSLPLRIENVLKGASSG
jgi:hypothetical protein